MVRAFSVCYTTHWTGCCVTESSKTKQLWNYSVCTWRLSGSAVFSPWPQRICHSSLCLWLFLWPLRELTGLIQHLTLGLQICPVLRFVLIAKRLMSFWKSIIWIEQGGRKGLALPAKHRMCLLDISSWSKFPKAVRSAQWLCRLLDPGLSLNPNLDWICMSLAKIHRLLAVPRGALISARLSARFCRASCFPITGSGCHQHQNHMVILGVTGISLCPHQGTDTRVT